MGVATPGLLLLTNIEQSHKEKELVMTKRISSQHGLYVITNTLTEDHQLSISDDFPATRKLDFFSFWE